jgi:hypothetical protein
VKFLTIILIIFIINFVIFSYPGACFGAEGGLARAEWRRTGGVPGRAAAELGAATAQTQAPRRPVQIPSRAQAAAQRFQWFVYCRRTFLNKC